MFFALLLAAVLAGLVGVVVYGLILFVGERRPAAVGIAGFAFLVVFAPLATLALALTRASAHEAPSGWSYPTACCSTVDCYPIAGTDIEATGAGYVIKASGELITYADKRIRGSPDGVYHRCSTGGDSAGSTICLFIPAGS